MKHIAIIYHDADFDGKLSNEVCRHWLSQIHPNAKIHSYGWDYGRPVPQPNGALEGIDDMNGYDSIYIVDLSVDELMARKDLRDKIVWIDHHKSAMEKWNPKGDQKYNGGFVGYRIDGVAACRLCWQWFLRDQLDAQDGGEGRFQLPAKEHFVNREVDEPWLLRLAGEYDIWDHRDPCAKALQFGLRSLSEEKLRILIHGQLNDCEDAETLMGDAIQFGEAIKSYCDKQNLEYSRDCSHTIHWEGLTWCALNIGQRGNSDLLLGGIKPEHDACFAWRYVEGKAYVSLYHIAGHEQHDLSLIATKYGGGGHRGACGFRIGLSRLSEILDNSHK